MDSSWDSGARDAQQGDGFAPRDSEVEDALVADAASGVDGSVPDGSTTSELEGTPLQGIRIDFDEPLELCDVWQEGGTLAEGRSRQVLVVIPPQSRDGLSRGELANARLSSGVIQSDAYASGTWVVEDEATTSVLTEWSVSGDAKEAAIFATIAHSIDGVGTIVETLSVRRSEGDLRSVIYRPSEAGEVTFTFERPGGAPVWLGRCGGPSELEDAVVVAAFVRAPEVVTVVREERTRLVTAGSAPVYPRRAQLWRHPTLRTEPQTVSSHFAQTYTAQHHNWYEHSLIDFTRDRRLSYLLFEPLAKGELPSLSGTIARSAELIGLGWSPEGRIEVRWLDLETRAESVSGYALVSDWRRVDVADVGRGLSTNCTNPVYRTFHADDLEGLPRFVLAGCAGSGVLGFDARVFIPVVFHAKPEDSGARFGVGHMRPTANGLGLAVELGEHRLEVVPERYGYSVVLRDASGSVLDSGRAYEAPLFGSDSMGGEPELRRARSADGRVETTMGRQLLGLGGGHSAIYAPTAFLLTIAGRRHHVLAWDRLEYTNTHHNWEDELIATTDSLRIRWHQIDSNAQSVRAERLSDGAEVLPETELEPAVP